MTSEEMLIKERAKKLQELRTRGKEPYPYAYEQRHHAKEINEQVIKLCPNFAMAYNNLALIYETNVNGLDILVRRVDRGRCRPVSP